MVDAGEIDEIDQSSTSECILGSGVEVRIDVALSRQLAGEAMSQLFPMTQPVQQSSRCKGANGIFRDAGVPGSRCMGV